MICVSWTSIKFLVFAILIESYVFALTPQQYCERLESKKANSLEILNIEITPNPNNPRDTVVVKCCNKGKFNIWQHDGSSGNNVLGSLGCDWNNLTK